jgi:hypothetical protein
MSTLTVHLIDDVGLPSAVSDAIRDRVADLLTRTISRAGALGVGTGGVTAGTVRWDADCPSGIPRLDVVIRFTAPPQQGPQFQCTGSPDGSWTFATRGLTTFGGSGTRSVVYVPECTGGATPQGNILGNIAYHELMHNKLQLGDALHSRSGVRLGGGGNLGPAVTPSDADVRLLAPHLGDEHDQLCS